MLHCWSSNSVKESTFKKNLLNPRSHLIEIAQRMTYNFYYQAIQVCSHVAAAATFYLDKWSIKNSILVVFALAVLFGLAKIYSEHLWASYLGITSARGLVFRNSKADSEKACLVCGGRDGILTSAYIAIHLVRIAIAPWLPLAIKMFL